MDIEKIGQFIKKIRMDNNLTQAQFAKKLNVSFQAVSKWETGKSIPDLLVIKEISDQFNVNIDEIINGSKKGNKYLKKENGCFGKTVLLLGLLLAILVSVIFILKSDTFEFKTISSKNSNFIVSGSVAYNKEKSSIYISDVKTKEGLDDTVYKSITCNLIESYETLENTISNCSKKFNQTIMEFVENINIKVDDVHLTCKKFNQAQMILQIKAINMDNKITIYNIPLVLNDSCN